MERRWTGLVLLATSRHSRCGIKSSPMATYPSQAINEETRTGRGHDRSEDTNEFRGHNTISLAHRGTTPTPTATAASANARSGVASVCPPSDATAR